MSRFIVLFFGVILDLMRLEFLNPFGVNNGRQRRND